MAIFAVLVGIALYAGVLSDVGGDPGDRTAETTLETLRSAAAEGDVVDPVRLRGAATGPSVGPTGFETNVTLATVSDEGGTDENAVARADWSVGPSPPDVRSGADPTAESPRDVTIQRARRSIAVRVAPGDVRPGVLRVRVWR